MGKTNTESGSHDPGFTSYLTFKLDLVKSAMLHRANQVYRRELGLDVRSLRLLRAICDTPGITATRLREITLVEKTLLSKDLTQLVSLKLVRRSIHPDDARHHQLWATAGGKRIRAASDDLGHAMENVMLSMLSSEEHATLNELLGKLSREFLAETGDVDDLIGVLNTHRAKASQRQSKD
ncbi:MAG TPA: MarR family winged helix-turn-helix transcriptional regulator [Burkholderiaceae bacterium]|nr:MarR family winged helix-turn-helix transcriptional regulator [Burkholderiaceae bacterium]